MTLKQKKIFLIRETKTWSFENKIDKPSQKWQKVKEKRYKLLTPEIKQEHITTDHVDIKKKTKYYKQLYNHKFDKLDEMDQFLEKYKLLQIAQYEIDHLNSPITIKEI